MTESERTELTDRRLNYYRERCRTLNALPACCFGYTLGDRPSLVACLPEDLSMRQVREYLAEALRQVDAALEK